jgi:GNAT superfamily N-acetyltransferase
VLEEQIFNVGIHDRNSFSCGKKSLDEFLQKYAAQQVSKNVTKVYVLVDSESVSDIIGFYSLSAAEIEINQIDEVTRKKLPRYPVPCFRLGRLAVSENHQGKNYGKMLLGCAISRCMEVRKHIGAYALIVDALDEQAKKFYEHFGFIPFQDIPLKLYLPFGK